METPHVIVVRIVSGLISLGVGERTLIYIFSLMLPSQGFFLPAERLHVGDSQRPCAERVQRAVLAEARFGSSAKRTDGASGLPRARLVGALIIRLAACELAERDRDANS